MMSKIMLKYLSILSILLICSCGGGSSGTDGGGNLRIDGNLELQDNSLSKEDFQITVIETGDDDITDQAGNFNFNLENVDSDVSLLIRNKIFESVVKIPNSKPTVGANEKVISITINVDLKNNLATIIYLTVDQDVVIDPQKPEPSQSEENNSENDNQSYGIIRGEVRTKLGVPIIGLLQFNETRNIASTDLAGKYRLEYKTESVNNHLNFYFKGENYKINLPKLPKGNVNILLNIIVELEISQAESGEDIVNNSCLSCKILGIDTSYRFY